MTGARHPGATGVEGPIGIFGGTFDPIHYGHLRTGFELLAALSLAEVRFMPAGNPPHREHTVASNAQRLSMVEVAVGAEPGFVVDDREMHRAGPSYTVETLGALRAEVGRVPLCLIIGMDAFLGLASWHRWTALFDLAHLVVAHRPGWRAPEEGALGELIRARATRRVTDLHEAPAGRLYIHAVTQLEISSTELRALIHEGRDPRYLMPDGVRKIIMDTGCYARKDEPRG